MISLQESLLVEADDLLMDYSCMTPMTEALFTSYDISDKDIEDKEKMTRAVNKMKRKRDLKALLRVLEVAIIAVIASRLATGVANALVILVVGAIIYVLYRVNKDIVKPATTGVKNFFNKQMTIISYKQTQVENAANKQNLIELNNILEKNLARIEACEKDYGSKYNEKEDKE